MFQNNHNFPSRGNIIEGVRLHRVMFFGHLLLLNLWIHPLLSGVGSWPFGSVPWTGPIRKGGRSPGFTVSCSRCLPCPRGQVQENICLPGMFQGNSLDKGRSPILGIFHLPLTISILIPNRLGIKNSLPPFGDVTFG